MSERMDRRSFVKGLASTAAAIPAIATLGVAALPVEDSVDCVFRLLPGFDGPYDVWLASVQIGNTIYVGPRDEIAALRAARTASVSRVGPKGLSAQNVAMG